MKGAQAFRRKIEGAEQLRSVVRTMKVLAAANIRECDAAVKAIARYSRAMELGFQAAVQLRPALLESPGERREERRRGVVVFGSDQGMCGRLNDDVVEHALGYLSGRDSGGEKPKVHVVGERAAARLERRGRFVLERVQSAPQSLSTIGAAVRQTVLRLESWRASEGVNEVVLFYAKRGSGAAFEPHRVRLLPVDRAWIEELKSRNWPSRSAPLLGLAPRRWVRFLLRQHLYIALFRGFAESMASENASRLASMEGAERNIDERLEDLERDYRRNRQTVITEELLDIVGGFEALEEDT